jgi:hypothetical protein
VPSEAVNPSLSAGHFFAFVSGLAAADQASRFMENTGFKYPLQYIG